MLSGSTSRGAVVQSVVASIHKAAHNCAKNYRIRIGKVSDESESNPSQVPALEASMRAYADKKASTVVNPVLRDKLFCVPGKLAYIYSC